MSLEEHTAEAGQRTRFFDAARSFALRSSWGRRQVYGVDWNLNEKHLAPRQDVPAVQCWAEKQPHEVLSSFTGLLKRYILQAFETWLVFSTPK